MEEDQKVRFHWSLSQAGQSFRRAQASKDQTGTLSFDAQLNLCRLAEQNGIESVLMAIGFTRPDPLCLSIALGMETEKIKFLVAVRSGLISPAYYVQQLNTASTILGDRLHINVVNGHTPAELRYYGDYINHGERYARTHEFMDICHGYWQGNDPVDYNGKYYQVEEGQINTPFQSKTGRPYVYCGGNSNNAVELAKVQGDCLWVFPDAPQKLTHIIEPLRKAQKETGILVSLIARPTQQEAEQACKDLLQNFNTDNKDIHADYNKRYDAKGFTKILDQALNNDSQWLTPYLWTGAVPYLGAPSISLVGSYDQIAAAIMEYKEAGITQFLFMGWPDEEEVQHFGKGVLPRVRKMEASLKLATV